MIEITDRIIGVWFVKLEGFDDWLATLTELPDGRIELKSRIRVADPLEPGADPFENLDSLKWANGATTMSRDETVMRMRMLVSMLASMFGTTPYEVLMNPERNVSKFFAELTAMPFAYVKTDEEAETYLREHGGGS